MRLKETTSNYHASSIVKRDWRHTSTDGVVRLKTKKDTNKYCNGNSKQPHHYRRYHTWHRAIEARCTNCGHISTNKLARNSSIPLRIDVSCDNDMYELIPNTANHPYTEVVDIGCGCTYCYEEANKWRYKN